MPGVDTICILTAINSIGTTALNIDELRADTPGCRERIHLNNAGASLMPTPVIQALKGHVELESRIGGYEAEHARFESIDAAYASVAKLLGSPPRNIAFTEHATASFAQALSSIPFDAGDMILTTRNDYISNQIQFLSLRKRLGVRILHAPDRPEGGVDVSAMAALIERHRPRLVSVTHIPTNSGLVQDVCAIGRACRDLGVTYLVDACQSLGQMPLDVGAIGCDFLSATARKFLRGPRGAGILYVSDRVLEQGLAPMYVDMRGAEWTDKDAIRLAGDARRFETWEFAWALVLATGEAARYADAVGLEAIQDRVRDLASGLRDRFAGIGGIRVLDRGPELSAIVSIAFKDADPQNVLIALRERGINTSLQVRGYAVMDFDDKGVEAALRVSPHYYNTERETDAAVATVDEIIHGNTRGA